MSQYPIKYRGYNIQPAEMGMWSWTHEDYDGPEDRRCGIGRNEAECRQEVDWLISELIDERLTKLARQLDSSSSELVDQKTAEAIRNLLWNASTETLLKIVDTLHDFGDRDEAMISDALDRHFAVPANPNR